jgi:hypothetical protein
MEGTMKLLQIDFSYRGPFGPEMTRALAGLADDIAREPGLEWKLWTENAATGEAGGVYLFADEGSARAYADKHTARLATFAGGPVRAKSSDVNSDLTRATRAPLG